MNMFNKDMIRTDDLFAPVSFGGGGGGVVSAYTGQPTSTTDIYATDGGNHGVNVVSADNSYGIDINQNGTVKDEAAVLATIPFGGTAVLGGVITYGIISSPE